MKLRYNIYLVMSIVLIICFLLLTGCNTLTRSAEVYNKADNAIIHSPLTTAAKEVTITPSSKKVLEYVKSLSSYKRRMGSTDEVKACNYLKDLLENYGYTAQIQNFPFDLQSKFNKDAESWDTEVSEVEKDGESRNIIAIKNTSDINSSKNIVISAHYDSNGSGVIDNATGVGVLLELSRIVKKLPLNIELRFILFGGEESGLIGSRYYINNLTQAEKKNILCNINLDCIGEEGPNGLILATNDGKANTAAELFYKDIKNKTLKIVDGPTSDYISFDKAGIPSVSIGQLSIPWKIDSHNKKLTQAEMEEQLLQFDSISRLDENKIQTALDILYGVLTKYRNIT